MSQVDVSRFVTLALDDENVRQKLETNPDRAFDGFDLTEEEREAIASADEGKLRQIGLDPMTAHSWAAFHDVERFAPDMPDLPGDVHPPG
jgi:hypothetical protein